MHRRTCLFGEAARNTDERAARFGHIKEENARKAAVEKARLEADLENSRFAAAAE
jgi:indolepyruvate ferredoxin oxidoreductase